MRKAEHTDHAFPVAVGPHGCIEGMTKRELMAVLFLAAILENAYNKNDGNAAQVLKVEHSIAYAELLADALGVDLDQRPTTD